MINQNDVTNDVSPEALQNAFQTFNQISDQLASSYHVLEERVSSLSDELSKTNDARIRELTEKEKLATRLSSLLQALPGGVIVLDGDGIIKEFNQEALELLGSPLEHMAWTDVIARSFSPRNDDGHEVSLVNGKRVNISTCPMVDGPGQILLFTDVTDMRALQDRLNQQKRLIAMGEMAASLAHQIRTPLASAMLYSSNLKHSKINDNNLTKYKTKIHERLIHLEHIVNDMLLYARSNSAGIEEEFTVSELYQELEQNIKSLVQKTNTNVFVSEQTGNVRLWANKQMLVSALTNLAVNAIESMHGDKELYLSSIKSNNTIEISIRDIGDGIEESNLESIFNPFFTTRQDGTGLGLAVVKAIISAHRGDIHVNSTVGEGTCFQVRMPIIMNCDTQSDVVASDAPVSNYG